jgi:hypothetical protein
MNPVIPEYLSTENICGKIKLTVLEHQVQESKLKLV